jgi:hypothetical protein
MSAGFRLLFVGDLLSKYSRISLQLPPSSRNGFRDRIVPGVQVAYRSVSESSF